MAGSNDLFPQADIFHRRTRVFVQKILRKSISKRDEGVQMQRVSLLALDEAVRIQKGVK